MYNKKIVTFYNPKQVMTSKVGYSRSPEKPKLLLEYLEKKGLLEHFDIRSDFKPFDKEDFYMAHTKEYVDGFFKGEKPHSTSNGLEWSPEFAETVRYTNASFYEAIRHAILNPKDVTFSPTSGFHHATPTRGGCFCTFSGQVIAARKIYQEFGKRALFLDYDAHYGNSIEDSRKMFPDLNDAIYMNFNPEPNTYGLDPIHITGSHKILKDAWNRNKWDYVVFCHGADSHELDDLGGECSTQEWIANSTQVYNYVRRVNNSLVDDSPKPLPVILSLFGGYRSDDYNSVLSLHTADLVQALNILTDPEISIDYIPEVKPRR